MVVTTNSRHLLDCPARDLLEDEVELMWSRYMVDRAVAAAERFVVGNGALLELLP